MTRGRDQDRPDGRPPDPDDARGPEPGADAGTDPAAERLGLSPHARRPAPLGLALAGAAAVVGVFSVLEGTLWLAVVAYPVVFLGGLLAGAGWPQGR